MAASSLLMFPLAGCAALAALVIASADAAALASPGAELIADPPTLRARRQTTRYDQDSSVDEDDWAARAQQAVTRYQNAVNRGWMPANSEEEDAARRAVASSNNNNNRNQQGTSSWSSPQQGRTRTRTSSSSNNGNPSSARQTSSGSNGYRPSYGTAADDQGYATRNAWGNTNGNNGDTNSVFGGDSGGGVFGSNGGGLFGNRPSIIGGLIRRLGFGFANTVQGVSSALANKWNTKASAARAFASSLLNTGRVGLNSGLQAGLAHPRFAMEAVENVF
ncbi:uncharacterized transmembrane protein DDB_G0289901 [Frankliniella occidentalis]|uniref:Uncharacterized transmembrane protein DDB_G0289901 n=1 Tax=Frankliniella occidentalis TaxID=133901 RepID=A0A6J1T2V0_FRAOC|nr:uncharacterized transmembrane protein DDB_G0289901 [Frankliniella occidentalis]